MGSPFEDFINNELVFPIDFEAYVDALREAFRKRNDTTAFKNDALYPALVHSLKNFFGGKRHSFISQDDLIAQVVAITLTVHNRLIEADHQIKAKGQEQS